jgi:hypothetical protein
MPQHNRGHSAVAGTDLSDNSNQSFAPRRIYQSHASLMN